MNNIPDIVKDKKLLVEVMIKIINCIPCYWDDGVFYMCDFDEHRNEVGKQHINPIDIISEILSIATNALESVTADLKDIVDNPQIQKDVYIVKEVTPLESYRGKWVVWNIVENRKINDFISKDAAYHICDYLNSSKKKI